MALGIEAAGGMVEKFLPGVSFPVLMNTVLPGMLALAALYPFAPPRWQNSLSMDVEKTWPALVLAALVVGIEPRTLTKLYRRNRLSAVGVGRGTLNPTRSENATRFYFRATKSTKPILPRVGLVLVVTDYKRLPTSNR